MEQQAKVIEMHTNLSVGHYIGEMAVDKWSKNQWLEEFKKNQVLVMTAQIFLDILHHGFVALAKVNLIGLCFCKINGDIYFKFLFFREQHVTINASHSAQKRMRLTFINTFIGVCRIPR